ncbi:polysaccharide biosynthesis protein [Brachybacterium huguangmaarense]|uniref:Polysaccharide biosynthesis protein n=1 Tax=Brachybacterium huguangmaarense TaxID=1652028 RepID=A0ABY6G3R4_9MICO|nr:nucleoside-diphosphate sugar epimerase/dehydratase [Brachybacterium huguangmaarense]UYG17266.1 polysaccharide biosynthesis protein [Brachybacterium huguangmaarense]
MATSLETVPTVAVSRRTRPFPPWLAVITDAAAWFATLLVLTVSRYLLADESSDVVWGHALENVSLVSLLAIALMITGGTLTGLYRRRYVVGSLDEARMLSFVAFGVWLLLTVVVLATLAIPRSVVLAIFPMALLLMGGVRLVFRRLIENRMGPGISAVPVLLYGAGELGHSVVRQMTVDPLSEFKPVGFIDDDPSKRGFVLNGLRVLGPGTDLAPIVEATGTEGIVICLNRVDSSFLRAVHDETDALGIRMLVFPSINEALTQKRTTSSLRDVSVDDLVGRHPAEIDLSSVAGYLSGKRVLVTGAGGSIGSELCRQIHKFGPSELYMLDRDESGLHSTQISIVGHGLLDTDDMILADIRDRDSLVAIFRDRRPDVVFHAAALKHLPMLEQYPHEAWKTNVLGTLNVLHAALDINVERFVNISTDKAADPTSVLGHSKRMAERLTAWAARQDNGSYVSVRFGNVLGSRGSMIPTFQAQIERGGPVTVTHPDVTRYFMTIPEACELVVQAGAIGQDGQVMILDMGEPVRILDVAQRMIEMSGKEVEVIFTGLRTGEKLHEDLFSTNEHVGTRVHPRISHARVPSADPEFICYELFDGARPQHV